VSVNRVATALETTCRPPSRSVRTAGPDRRVDLLTVQRHAGNAACVTLVQPSTVQRAAQPNRVRPAIVPVLQRRQQEPGATALPAPKLKRGLSEQMVYAVLEIYNVRLDEAGRIPVLTGAVQRLIAARNSGWPSRREDNNESGDGPSGWR